MKKLIIATLFFYSLSSLAQDDNLLDSTGLAGDHFSLEIALDLFSKSESIEDFEQKINAEENHANNLDINGDGEIDYIRVVDYVVDNDHALALEVPVSETESQNIAVIEIEKNGEASAQLQIVGDEEMYGEERYVEPVDEKATNGKGGPSVFAETRLIVVNVWFWPGVRFMYSPAYNPWISPWRWRHYPGYWKPWRPVGWRAYYGYCRPFHARYHVVGVHRCTRAHAVHRAHRVSSAVVHARYKDAHTRHVERSKSASKVKASKRGDKSNKGKGDKGNSGKKEKVSKDGQRNESGMRPADGKSKSGSSRGPKTDKSKGTGTKGSGKRK